MMRESGWCPRDPIHTLPSPPIPSGSNRLLECTRWKRVTALCYLRMGRSTTESKPLSSSYQSLPSSHSDHHFSPSCSSSLLAMRSLYPMPPLPHLLQDESLFNPILCLLFSWIYFLFLFFPFIFISWRLITIL